MPREIGRYAAFLVLFFGASVLLLVASRFGGVLFTGTVTTLLRLLPYLLIVLVIYWLITQFSSQRPAPPRGAHWRRRRRRRALSDPLAPLPAEGPAAWTAEAEDLADDIQQMVRESGRAARRLLGGLPGRAKKLAARVRDLAQLYAGLDEHLTENTPEDASRRLVEMEQRAQSASDPLAREQYLSAIQVLQRQLVMYRELARTQERLHAEISRILAALASLRARIAAARSGAAAALGDIERATEELAVLQTQVDAFHDSIRHVIRQPPRA